MANLWKELWEDESGVTAVEYGLIAGLIAAVLVVIFGMFSDSLKGLFEAISNKLDDATDTVKDSKGPEVL